MRTSHALTKRILQVLPSGTSIVDPRNRRNRRYYTRSEEGFVGVRRDLHFEDTALHSHELEVEGHDHHMDHHHISGEVVRTLLVESVYHSLGHSSHPWEVVAQVSVLCRLLDSSREAGEVRVDRSIRRIGHGEESADGSFGHQGVHLGSTYNQKTMLMRRDATHICCAMYCRAFEFAAIKLLDS